MSKFSVTDVASFISRACARHGGLDAFGRLGKLELQVVGLRGAVPWFKGLGRTFPAPSGVDVWPHEQRAVLLDYPTRGNVSVYQSGRVATGRDSVDRNASLHRTTFGPLTKWRRWSPEDAVYFFGYSIVDYVSVPFTLIAHEPIDARITANGGVELWYRFPAGTDTHSAVQGFYFDESGLLVRHDYRAEILGRIFNGAHIQREHMNIQGIVTGTHRIVFAKPWHYPIRTMLPLPVLEARLLPRT